MIFDPDLPFGPWLYYIAFACTLHTTLQAAIAITGVFWRSAQRPLYTLGTAIAMCSAAGFLVALAFGNDVEFERAVLIAWRIALFAAVGGPILFFWSLFRLQPLFIEMGMPLWVTVTNVGGLAVFLVVLAMNTVGAPPGLEGAFAIIMLLGLALYWSPLVWLPWKLLTRMEPMNFAKGISMRIPFFLVLFALSSLAPAARAAAPISATIEGHMLTLHFPVGTLHGSVWLQLDGHDVPRSLSRGRNAAVHWIDADSLSVNLHLVKRRINMRWAHGARVWGQQKNGDALLQLVQFPDHAKK